MTDQNDSQDSSLPKISKKEAVHALWKKGILHWKLNSTQKQMYDKVAEADKRIIVWLASRRLGKTFTLCVMAIEKCIKEKNAIVKYLCPDAKQARTVIIPIIREILEDCPKSLRPEYLKNDGKYVFPNGSEIQIAGNDGGRAESLRGGFAHLCIIDEAGFCDNLKYNVQSILLPTVTTTGGKIVLSSTPPKTPGHEFNHFVKRSKDDKTFIKKTIFENTRFTPAQVQEIIDTYGSVEDPEFRREYVCEMAINLDDAIVPEFTEAVKLDTVKEHKRPPFFDYYVSADIGFKDYTAILFAYYDFLQGKLIVEDEIVVNKKTTHEIARLIKEKEQKLLWEPTTNEMRFPHLRVSDNNLFVINDLQKLHGITFVPTMKDDKEAAINNMRIMINAKKVIIHPRCITLIKHLEEGTWKKSGSGKTRDFDRSSDNGHFDTLDALIYLIRNVQFSKNPYPAGYNMPSKENNFQYREKPVSDAYQQLANLYKFKKSL